MFKIGESTVMHFDRISSKKDGENLAETQVKVTIRGTLRARTNDLEFVLEMIDSQKLEIAGIEIPTRVSEKERGRFGYDKQKENLAFLKKACQVMDALNVKKDLNIKNIR